MVIDCSSHSHPKPKLLALRAARARVLALDGSFDRSARLSRIPTSDHSRGCATCCRSISPFLATFMLVGTVSIVLDLCIIRLRGRKLERTGAEPTVGGSLSSQSASLNISPVTAPLHGILFITGFLLSQEMRPRVRSRVASERSPFARLPKKIVGVN